MTAPADVGSLSPDERRALEAELLRKAMGRRRENPLRPRAEGEMPPLGLAQRRLWFFHELTHDRPLYHSLLCFRLDGPLDIEALRSSIDHMVRRHEILRTRIVTDHQEEPVQAVDAPAPVTFTVTDLTGKGLTTAVEFAEAQLQRPFNLTLEWPLRVELIRLGEQCHVLLVVVDHIVSDGRSVQTLSHELSAGYAAFLDGHSPDLPPLPIQYGDFAIWQDRLRGSPSWNRELDYWRRQLADIPMLLGLPLDHPRPRSQSFRGDGVLIDIPPEVVQAAEGMGAETDATLFMTLLAAYHVLLHCYSGDTTTVVGVPVAGRKDRQLENLIGFFVNSLAIRADFADRPSFRSLLRQVRGAVLGGMDHQQVPFEAVVDALGGPRDLSHNPVYQTMFQLNPAGLVELGLRGLTSTRLFPQLGTSDLDIGVDLSSRDDGGLIGWLQFAADIFDRATMERLVRHYSALVRALCAEPDVPIGNVSFLTGDERETMLRVRSAGPVKAVPDRWYHEYVSIQAAAAPHAIAVESPESSLTYRELDERSNRIAHRLTGQGAGAEVVIALLLEPSTDMIATILGILKAQSTFLAIDSRNPRSWIDFVLADSKAVCVITDERFEHLVPGTRVIRLRQLLDRLDAYPVTPPQQRVHGHQAAALFYTSGSTGRPKGVVYEHRNLANHAVHGFEPLGLTAADRTLQFASVSFDAFVEEIIYAFSKGGTLVLRGRDFDLSPSRFVEQVGERHLTVLNLPTSYWHELVRAGAAPSLARCESLRLVALGGEPVAPDSWRRWRDEAGRVRLLNGYAPTETTIASSWHELGPGESDGPVPIGRPTPNTHDYVLDELGQPVGAGVVGELCISGEGVARGYIGRPDLTSQVFVPDPFSDRPGARIYRTGDLARYNSDGNLVLIGRRDNQVKLRGYRIEPAHIEITLREHPRVWDAAVRVRDLPSGKALVGYVAVHGLTEDNTVLERDVRGFLADRLPSYMVPAAFVWLEKLPRTPAGKLDRERLTEPGRQPRATGPGTPRDAIELRLLTLWRQVLDAPDIGVKDDFFAHGGHSLLAVRLVNLIEREFGRALPVSALFPYATVERVAYLIRESADAELSPLIQLRRGTGGTQVVLAHPVGGEVTSYLPLARALPAAIDVFGLRSPEPAAGSDPLPQEISSMAASYLQQLRTDTATVYGGWSLGGLIALEMARQVALQAAAPPPVVAIDCAFRYQPEVAGDGRSEETALRGFATNLARSLGLEPPGTIPPGLDNGLAAIHAKLAAADVLPEGVGIHWLRQRFDTYCRNATAAARFRPQPYPGEVVLFLTAGRPDFDDVVADWERLVRGELSVHAIEADHYSIVAEQAAAQIAKILTGSLFPLAPSGTMAG